MGHGFGTVTYNYDTKGMNYLTDWNEDTDGNGQYELTVKYQYDKQGNPQFKAYRDAGLNKEITRETYQWNDRDELVAVSGKITENYVYDYKGLRNSRIAPIPSPFPNAGAREYEYIYLQSNQPAMKITKIDYTSPSMNDIEYADVFVYEGSKRIMRIRVNKDGSTNKEYFINDYQGSPVVVVAEDESIKYQNYQDPWGNMEMSIGVPTSNPEFTYTDKELDEDSGLYYFQARYYDPIAGRFMGRDPVTQEDILLNHFYINSYQYCQNNPVRYIDQDGRFGEEKYTIQNNGNTADSVARHLRVDVEDLQKMNPGADWSKGSSVKRPGTGLTYQAGQMFSKLWNAGKDMVTPTKGKINVIGGYNADRRRDDGSSYKHSATDIKSNAGSPVYAPVSGKISYLHDRGTDLQGRVQGVIIGDPNTNGNDVFHVVPVSGLIVGDEVVKGQLIGYTQDIHAAHSNYTNHVHWKARSNGEPVNVDNRVK